MGKNKENIKIWISIFSLIFVVIIAIISASIGYGRNSERMDRAEKDIQTIDAAVYAEEHRNDDQDKYIFGLQKDVSYIREAVDRIESKLDADRTGKNRVE